MFMLYPMVSLASTVEEQRQAILETAMAFYRKDSYVQYDSYRQMVSATPEDATPNHIIYTDCSTFTYQVYKEALGIESFINTSYLAEYADKYAGKESIIFNMHANNNDNTNIKNELNNWLNHLNKFKWETGDLIVYRRIDGTGHVIMVDASNPNDLKYIESGYTTSGGWYDATNYIDKLESRSISTGSLFERFQKMINYTDNNKINQLSIIRYITNGSTYIDNTGKTISYDITSSAKSRIKYPSMDIIKTSQVSSPNAILGDNFATIGSTIAYQITIKNNSNTPYYNIVIEEEKDSKVTFKLTSNGKVNGNKITFNIPLIKPHTSNTSFYIVSIADSKDMLGEVVTSKGMVEGIKNRTIRTNIYNAFSLDNIEILKNTYNSLKNDNSKDSIFISKIYKQAFNYDISYLNNLDIYDILSISHCSNNNVCQANITNSNISNIALLNYYGLRITPYSYNNTNGVNNLNSNLINGSLGWNVYNDEVLSRARSIKVSNLQIGDIILVKKSISKENNTKSYLYIGNKQIVRNKGGSIETISGNSLDSFLNNLVGENYLILRPAIMMDSSYVKKQAESLNVPSQSQATAYLSSSKKPTSNNGSTTHYIYSAAGEENPDSGASIPFVLFGILGAILLVISLIIKPIKFYKIK